MRHRALFATALLALLASSACVAVPQYADVAAFPQRAPAPGQPDFAQTVKYVDDGLRYVDPLNAFFIPPDGRMCFRGAFSLSQTIFDYLAKSDWCLPATAVDQVELVPDVVTGTYKLQLSCKHGAGQCVEEIGLLRRQTAIVTLPIVPPGEEKRAIEHLVYLMGGDLGEAHPFR